MRLILWPAATGESKKAADQRGESGGAPLAGGMGMLPAAEGGRKPEGLEIMNLISFKLGCLG